MTRTGYHEVSHRCWQYRTSSILSILILFRRSAWYTPCSSQVIMYIRYSAAAGTTAQLLLLLVRCQEPWRVCRWDGICGPSIVASDVSLIMYLWCCCDILLDVILYQPARVGITSEQTSPSTRHDSNVFLWLRKPSCA